MFGEPNPIVALEAATGKVRWQTPVSVETHTAGALVVEGKVISGRACNTARSNCYLAAHDARTGKEAWRFHTSPGAGVSVVSRRGHLFRRIERKNHADRLPAMRQDV